MEYRHQLRALHDQPQQILLSEERLRDPTPRLSFDDLGQHEERSVDRLQFSAKGSRGEVQTLCLHEDSHRRRASGPPLVPPVPLHLRVGREVQLDLGRVEAHRRRNVRVQKVGVTQRPPLLDELGAQVVDHPPHSGALLLDRNL